MRTLEKLFLLLFLGLIFFSCNKQNEDKKYVLDNNDLSIIQSVQQTNWTLKDDYNRTIELLNKAIEAKPYVWEFYNYKIWVSQAYYYEQNDYGTFNQKVIEYMENYIKNTKSELTVLQNYLYGFSLMLENQNEKAMPYLKKASKYLTKVKKTPEYGSEEETNLGCAIICAFLSNNLDENKLKKYESLFQNNTTLYESYLALVRNETPESLVKQNGTWSW